MIGNYNINTRTPYKPQAKPTRDGARRVLWHGYPLYLPDDETLERFKAAFPNTENEQLTELVGRSSSYVSRLGNYLGLKKSAEFSEMRERKAKTAKRRDPKKGAPTTLPERLKKFRYGQPEGNKRQSPEEKRKQMLDLWAKERMRVKYGLQQKTKLRVKL